MNGPSQPLVKATADLLVSVRSSQFVYLRKFAAKAEKEALNDAVDGSQLTWQLYGTPMSAATAASIVSQAPELLDQLGPRMSETTADAATSFLKTLNLGWSQSKGSKVDRGRMSVPVSISEAIEISTSVSEAIRTSLADSNGDSRYEGMYRLWGRHREANLQAFLVIGVARTHQNAGSAKQTVEIVPIIRLYSHQTRGNDEYQAGIPLESVSVSNKQEPTKVDDALRRFQTTGRYLGGVTDTLEATQDHLDMREDAIATWVHPLVQTLLETVNTRLISEPHGATEGDKPDA